jgi:hypothetical protein
MSDPVAEAAAQLAQGAENTGVQVEPDVPGMPAISQSPGVLQVAESPNEQAAQLAPGFISDGATELPNVASGAAEPTIEQGYAPSADGANTTLPTGASSAEPEATDSRPLHVRVAAHLEAIFQMVKTDTQRAPTDAESYAEHVKNHVESVLHHIYNGMQVSEGELVRKLETLYRML